MVKKTSKYSSGISPVMTSLVTTSYSRVPCVLRGGNYQHFALIVGTEGHPEALGAVSAIKADDCASEIMLKIKSCNQISGRFLRWCTVDGDGVSRKLKLILHPSPITRHCVRKPRSNCRFIPFSLPIECCHPPCPTLPCAPYAQPYQIHFCFLEPSRRMLTC